MNKQEWIDLLIKNKDNIRNIIINFHPILKNKTGDPTFPISAKNAGAACEEVRGKILRDYIDKGKNDPISVFDLVINNNGINDKENYKLASILNEAWFGLPESMSSREVPGFGVLCDLCSESDCLLPEQEIG